MMPAPLLDANVLIALTFPAHVHHDAARRWLVGQSTFALCPTVEGAYVRFALRIGEPASAALAMLERVHALPACRLIAESLRYTDVDLDGVIGHRQVTDAYLAALAQQHGLVLATFDRALCDLRPTSTVLVG